MKHIPAFAVAFAALALVAGCNGDGIGVDSMDMGETAAPDLSEVPDLMAPASGIGNPCTGGGGFTQGSCNDGQLCIPDGQFGNVDGYCTAQCSGMLACPTDATCISFGQLAVCLLDCDKDSDCRVPDYSCQLVAQGQHKVCVAASPGGGGNTGGPAPATRDGGACVTPIVDPAPTLFGANVQLSPAGTTPAAEVQLDVAPGNKDVVVSWITLAAQGAGIGVIHSGDDAAGWESDYTLPVDQTLDKNREQSDPIVAVDGMGNFWIVWVGFDRSQQNPNPSNMHMFAARSTNGGVSFDELFQISPNNEATGQTLLDKPWIAASKLDGTVYATWMRGAVSTEIRMARFDGKAWGAPVTINDAGKRALASRNLAQVAIADDGHPVVAWVEVGAGQQFGATTNQVYVQAFKSDATKSGANVLVTRAPDSPPFEDPSLALYQDNVYVGFVSGDAKGVWDIRASASTDGGATFAASVKVNDDVSCATHFHHQIATDGKGNVHAVWFDNRYLAGNVFHAVSGPADAMNPLAFGKNTFVNDRTFTFTTRRDQANWLGDYLGFGVVGDEIYAAWTDNRTTNRAQIYFAKGRLK